MKLPIDFAKWRAIILQVMALQSQTARGAALIEAAKLRQLQQIEDLIARELARCGWAADDAVEDTLRFMLQTMNDHEARRATAGGE